MTTVQAKQDTEFKYTFTCAVCSTEYGANYRVPEKKKRYCSDACKSQQHRAKAKKNKDQLAARRLMKLPCNDFFLWIARECKRAGTVEILQNHTVESLEQLHQIYLYKMRCFGYNPEAKTNRYHICHIHAAVTDDRIGLLHPCNLFIGDSFRNQALGNKTAPSVGMAISRSILKSEWLVDEADTDRKVLDKVARYLGRTLRAYAADNPIARGQRFVLIDWILEHQSEYLQAIVDEERFGDQMFTTAFLKSELEKKSTNDLRKIRAEIEGKEHLKINLKPARSFKVYIDEVHRLAEQLPESRHKEDLIWLSDVLRVCATYLKQELASDDEKLDGILVHLPCVFPTLLKMKPGMDVNKFRDWLSFTAFQALQGFPVNRDLVQNTLKGYLKISFKKIDYSSLEKNDWSARHYADAIAQHRSQVSALQASALSLDLDYTVSFSARSKPNRPARHIATIPAPVQALVPTAQVAPDYEMDFDTPPF